LWARIEEHREALTASGEWDERRRGQQLAWMWAMVEDRLLAALHADSAVLDVLADAERRVLDGVETPSAAADRILDAFGGA
jgi:LAO/AO transport system kinase